MRDRVLDLDVAHDEPTVAPPFADDFHAAVQRCARIRACASGRTRRIVAVEREVLAHERNGIAQARRPRRGRRALRAAARAISCGIAASRTATAIASTSCSGPRFSTLIAVMRGRRRAARDARMHGDRRDETRKAHAEDGRERAARRHARDEDALAIDAIRAAHAADLRRDDGRFAVAMRRARVEPVPAPPWIGRVLLRRQEDHAFLRGRRTRRCACRARSRRPSACSRGSSTTSGDRRKRERALWNVHEVVAARPYGGCAADPAVRGELRSRTRSGRAPARGGTSRRRAP